MALGPNEPITHAKLLQERVEALEAGGGGGGNGGITPLIINGKGDIIVGSAADIPAVLPVGADGQVLSADSSTSTGLNWVTISVSGGGGAVSSVAGRTGDVTLTKVDVGLDQVSNTSDANKPISTATQTALNTKATTAEVSDALSAKANSQDVAEGLAEKESLTSRNAPGGYAGLSSSGRVSASSLGQVPVVLTDASSITTDASLSNQFRVILGGNRTLANPTNAFDGQLVMWSIKQDSLGSRTLALGTKFRFGTDITAVVLSTNAGKTDKLGAQYNNEDDKWDVVSFVRGF